MNKRSWIYLVVILGFFVGSTIYMLGNQENIETSEYNRIPLEVQEMSEALVGMLFDGNEQGLLDSFDSEFSSAEKNKEGIKAVVDKYSQYSKPSELTLVGYHFDLVSEINEHNITYEVPLGDAWALVNTNIVGTESNYSLYSMNFVTLEQSLKETNKFSFDKGFLSILFLLLSVAIFIFTVVTSAICFGRKEKSWIIWTFLCLVGVLVFGINWTTGHLLYNVYDFGFPTFGIGRQGAYAPIFVTLRFPLFAIIYWVRDYKRKQMKIEDVKTEEV